MRIAYLLEPTYTNLSKAIKKLTLYKDDPVGTKNKSNLSPNFFNGKHPNIDFDLYYLHQWENEEERQQQEAYILENIQQEKYDFILHSPAWRKVTDDFYAKLHQSTLPLVSIFADSLSVTTSEEMRIIKNSDYVIVYDSLTNYLRYRALFEASRSNDRSGVVFAAGHQFPADIYKKETCEYAYDASLLGSLEGFRMNIAMYLHQELSKRGFVFHCAGGIISFDDKKPTDARSETFLDFDSYLQAINLSKINLVSQTRPERMQIKCKVFEYMACGAFVLADKNMEYDLFVPAETMVTYTSLEDCLEKILYYLAHEEERNRIAQNGFDWFSKHFNYWKFWEDTFYAIKARSRELPAPLRIKEINQLMELQGNLNDLLYAEVKQTICKRLEVRETSFVEPMHTIASSFSQKNLLTNPLATRFWKSEPGLPQWLLFDFNEKIKFNVIHVHHLFALGGVLLKDFSIEGSNDLATWIALHQGEMSNLELLQIIHFKNDQPYRFYRLQCLSNYHGSNQVALADILFYQSDAKDIISPVKQKSPYLQSLTFKGRTLFYKVFKRVYRYLPSFLQNRTKHLYHKIYSPYLKEVNRS